MRMNIIMETLIIFEKLYLYKDNHYVLQTHILIKLRSVGDKTGKTRDLSGKLICTCFTILSHAKLLTLASSSHTPRAGLISSRRSQCYKFVFARIGARGFIYYFSE